MLTLLFNFFTLTLRLTVLFLFLFLLIFFCFCIMNTITHAVEVNNINLAFDGQLLFSDLSLVINYGSKAALTGDSGSGKSSVINLILGFLRPLSGNIIIHGTELNADNVSNIRKLMCWLPQDLSIIGRESVQDTILAPFMYSDNKHLRHDIKYIIEQLECLNLTEDILSHSMSEISGGEKQRIGIIICKMLNRDIILLDEPTSALDANSKAKVINYLLEDNPSTIIASTHDEEWLRHCTDIFEIEKLKKSK